ncbi:MAG: hypothetical protein Q7V57_15705 [Actinomycetota bacterium]|nr:hypothetical protein [Actinomycetota bacterium]
MTELDGAVQFFAHRAAVGVERPPLPEPTVLRWLTLAGVELTAAVAVISSLVNFRRLQVIRDYVDGVATSTDVEHGDDIARSFVVVLGCLVVFTTLMLAMWTFRTVKNAAVRHPSTAPGPWGAALFWFVPIGWYIVPWSRLRWASRAGGAPDVGMLTMWQVLFLFSTCTGSLGSWWARDVNQSSVDDIVTNFERYAIVTAMGAVLVVSSAVAAVLAMPRIDRQTSGTAPRL